MPRKGEPITAVNNECVEKFLRLTQQRAQPSLTENKTFLSRKFVRDVRRIEGV